MKQLSERQIEQQADDARGMRHTDELKSRTGEKLRADGQHQTGDADGEQQKDRKDVVCKGLYRKFALVAHSKLYGEHQSGEQNDRGDVQQVEVQETAQAVNVELLNRKSNHEHSIDLRIVRHRFEVNPAEDQRKRHCEREHSAPGKAGVHDPSLFAAPCDETLQDEIVQQAA